MIEKKSSSEQAMVLILLPEQEDIFHLADRKRLEEVVKIWRNLPPRGAVVIELPKITKPEKATAGRAKVQKIAL